MKSDRDAANCWKSLLEGQYKCDPMVMDQMEKKMTLERFQREVSKRDTVPQDQFYQEFIYYTLGLSCHATI